MTSDPTAVDFMLGVLIGIGVATVVFAIWGCGLCT
jgi:hypothetical protein